MSEKVTDAYVLSQLREGKSPFTEVVDGEIIKASGLNLLGGYVCSYLSKQAQTTIMWDQDRGYKLAYSWTTIDFKKSSEYHGTEFTPTALGLTAAELLSDYTALFCGFESYIDPKDYEPRNEVDWAAWMPTAFISGIDATSGVVRVGIRYPWDNVVIVGPSGAVWLLVVVKT